MSALVNTQVELPPSDPEGQKARRQRYALRNTVSRILGKKERAGRCGCKAVGASVSIVRKNNRAHLSGVETCGSIWACPVCAARISETRRQEVRLAISKHWEQGGRVYMMAFTAPHHFGQDCKDLKDRISGSWKKLLAGDPWQRIKEQFGIEGYIRALEVTHGKNGWHPHLHVLFFTETSLTELEERDLEGRLFERWDRIVNRESGLNCNRAVFRLELCSTPDAAGDYVAKWGADSELTKLHTKDAKGGGRSPWQLLKLAKDGGHRSAYLFRQFYQAFKGARQLTWSKDLKKRFSIDDLTDHEITADDTHDRKIVDISNRDFRKVEKRGAVAELLDIAENGGAIAVYAFLSRLGGISETVKALERRAREFPKIPEIGQLLQEATHEQIEWIAEFGVQSDKRGKSF